MKFSENGIEILKTIYHEAYEKGNIRGKKIKEAYMTDLLQLLVDQGHKIKAVPIFENWVEIDTIDDLKNRKIKARVDSIDNE